VQQATTWQHAGLKTFNSIENWPLCENLTRRHGDALEYCLHELNRDHPDYQAAQVYATLSVEEALRDLATAIGWAADRIR
jgi:hypothetical protein